jgi:ribosomal protein L40E
MSVQYDWIASIWEKVIYTLWSISSNRTTEASSWLTEHFSIEWTLELVSCKYYWLKLVKDVKKYVFSCNICQRVKVLNIIHMMKCRHYPHSNSLWEKVIMNMITGLPSSKHSDSVYDVILMIVDHYIMTQYISISKTLTAMQLADIFFEKIVCLQNSQRDSVW